MRARGRSLLAGAAGVLLAACTLPPLESPTPSPTVSPTASVTPAASRGPLSGAASPSPVGTPAASFDPEAIPDFSGGEIVTTTFGGLRVRQLPGTTSTVVAGLLPAGAELEVVMGPIVVDDIGWYMVNDIDPAEPAFEEAWVAAGFEPEPNLRSTGRVVEGSRVVASLAQTGDAEFGPIDVPDERHLIRWVAVDPERVRCQFSVSLAAGGAAPIPAIRSTVGDDLVPGTLQSTFFIGQPTLRGQLFLTTQTDCAWALAVVREPPPVEPSPSP